MKKYFYYLYLILNLGMLYFMAQNNVQLTMITSNTLTTFFDPILTAVNYVIPVQLGFPFTLLQNFILFISSINSPVILHSFDNYTLSGVVNIIV